MTLFSYLAKSNFVRCPPNPSGIEITKHHMDRSYQLEQFIQQLGNSQVGLTIIMPRQKLSTRTVHTTAGSSQVGLTIIMPKQKLSTETVHTTAALENLDGSRMVFQ